MSAPKITIPDGLRADILAAVGNLKNSQADAAKARSDLQSELAQLTAESKDLEGQIPDLDAKALADSSALSALVQAETRQRLVTDRINAINFQLAHLEPISLMEIERVFQDVLNFYTPAVKAAIVEALRPFCPNEARAGQIAGFSDAFTQLRGVAARAGSLRALSASHGTILTITQILNRVLSGQFLLLQDTPDPKQEVAA